MIMAVALELERPGVEYCLHYFSTGNDLLYLKCAFLLWKTGLPRPN